MNSKIKYGILGCSSLSKRFIKGIQESKDGIVYAISSRDNEKLKQFSKESNIEYSYSSYEDMLNDEHVDVVYIPTPNYLHYKHALQALQHNKHVVCEKPFTLTLQEATDLFDYAKAHNLFIMEAQKAPFVPASIWLKEQLNQGIIGKVSYISLTMSYPAPDDDNHWMNQSALGGGTLYTSGSYPIEWVSYLLDSQVSNFTHRSIIGHTGVDELSSITLEYECGCIAHSTISKLAPTTQVATFFGDKGSIQVPYFWRPNQIVISDLNDNKEIISFPFTSEFTYEVDHINHCIQNGLLTSPIITKEMTLQCTNFLESNANKVY